MFLNCSLNLSDDMQHSTTSVTFRFSAAGHQYHVAIIPSSGQRSGFHSV